MNALSILLQSAPAATTPGSENYLTLLMKGGWILVPIFLLLFLSIYVMIERWVIIRKAAGGRDRVWITHTNELIKEGKIEKAAAYCANIDNSSATVIRAGLKDIDDDIDEIEESMQQEARMEISRLELRTNYLVITSAIAPMLGFLGTIFGVIRIFYTISSNEGNINIANITDGLYQKMICSGAGLFVGIIAYAAFYLLNSRIDRTVTQMEKNTNEILKTIRQYKKKGAANEN